MVAIIGRQRIRFQLIQLFDVDDLSTICIHYVPDGVAYSNYKVTSRYLRNMMLFNFNMHSFSLDWDTTYFSTAIDISKVKTMYARAKEMDGSNQTNDLNCFYSPSSSKNIHHWNTVSALIIIIYLFPFYYA